MIIYSHQIFEFLSPALSIFQKKNSFVENNDSYLNVKKYDVVIIGLGRFGNRLSEMLDSHAEISYLGIDFDPSIIKEWRAKGRDIVYGDIDDPELLEQIPYQDSKVIVSYHTNI